ncbi:hypothetical protein SNE40_005760 [Patella caerulea]|uniref:Cyclin-dependent kinase inhibitor domain-containing protein n=1 Tax=Patella caerulea TaxID=87958 RepID=A0AAN8K493_PATCE
MSAVTTTDRSRIMKKSKACRCLFGPVDHESVRKDLDSQLNMDSGSTNEWNFNFSKDVPLEGRYEWTEVNTDYVPEYYRKGYTTRVPPTPRKVNIRPQFTNNTNSMIKKPTAVRRLNTLFRDSESESSTDLSDNTSGTASTTVPTAIHPPSTPRTPRSRRSRNEVGSQSRISDFMSIRKRRVDCDSPSASQRKLPRI